MTSKYRTRRTPKEGIGIGGVMSTICWLDTGTSKEDYAPDCVSSGVHVDRVVEKLIDQYSVNSEYALRAIDMAKMCGVIKEDEENKLYVLPRPKNY